MTARAGEIIAGEQAGGRQQDGRRHRNARIQLTGRQRAILLERVLPITLDIGQIISRYTALDIGHKRTNAAVTTSTPAGSNNFGRTGRHKHENRFWAIGAVASDLIRLDSTHHSMNATWAFLSRMRALG